MQRAVRRVHAAHVHHSSPFVDESLRASPSNEEDNERVRIVDATERALVASMEAAG
jgi:hypothetical protein